MGMKPKLATSAVLSTGRKRVSAPCSTAISIGSPFCCSSLIYRESTIAFKGSNLSVPQIAEQLHVDALIEGTVLRANDTARVTVRLTAARPERQLWAASYELNASDLIQLQNQLAADAVNHMRAQLTPQGKTQLNLESKINPEAYDEYMQAQFLLHQDQGAGQYHKAIPHLERVIQLDPDFAGAYAAMGRAWGLEGALGGNRPAGKVQEIYRTSLAYSQKAVNLDPRPRRPMLLWASH